MATAGPSNFEDLTTCMICLETFTRPKRLPCEHSYCHACLMLLGKDKSTITCPYCQEEHEIPTSGISGFKDNLLLSNLIGMSLPKSEVCTDCEERPSVPDECEHCGQKICHKCLVEHAKLSMELTNSVSQLKEDFSTSISQDRKLILETYESDLEAERRKMTEIFREEAVNKLVEVKILLERSEFMNELMRNIGELYKILRNEDEKAKLDSYTSSLSEKIGECSTIDSLKGMKSNMTDLKTFHRLMQTKDEEFRFRYSTSTQEGSSQLEFGQAVVNVRGNYLTQNIVDQITQLVQDSAEILSKHVATTCEPRVDHVLPLPPARGTRDAKTETEERFLEPIRGKETAVVDSDIEKKRSESANVASCSNQVSSDNSSSASSESMPTSELSKSEKPGQNELPRHVDYAGKARRREVVVGRGEAVREEDRLSLPLGCDYHEARDEILVADLGYNRIMAYSPDGEKARVFYTDARDPRDVAVSRDGIHVYIATLNSVIKVNMDGRHVKTIKHFSLGDFKICLSVVCHREFTVVVDIGHKRVIVFNDRDEEVRCFGREHLENPGSVAVSEDGMLYVTDDESSCVKVFDWGGQYIQTFADTDRDGDIRGIAVDGEGNVSVSRPDSHRIDVYTPRRELLTSIGGPGDKPEELSLPHGLCLTRDGRLIVADWVNHRVQIF